MVAGGEGALVYVIAKAEFMRFAGAQASVAGQLRCERPPRGGVSTTRCDDSVRLRAPGSLQKQTHRAPRVAVLCAGG